MSCLRLLTSADEPDVEAIARAAAVIRCGGVVAYPTDTLYGLAADPTSPLAVSRLFALKGRPASSAIPLIAADELQVASWAGQLSETAHALARQWWPGPLSLVLPALPGLCEQLLAGGDSVAVRVPAHPVAVALARAVGRPITATSANPSGAPPTARPDELVALLPGLDAVLDAGPAPGGPPSTIVDVTTGVARLVRAGAVPWDRVLESLRK